MHFHPTPENPVPRGALCHEIVTADGVHLRTLSLVQAQSKGTVVLLGGRADFMERYFETVRDLARRGYSVVSFDWRGQGGSQRLLKDRLRGYVRRFGDFDKDLDAVITQLVVPHCPPPYFALAHSTGGHVLLRALRKKAIFRKAVIVSPLLEFIYGAWPKGIAKALANLAVVTGLGWMYLPGRRRGPLRKEQFNSNVLTSDRERWDRDIETLDQHPHLRLAGPTFGWFRAALSSMADLRKLDRKHLIGCPVLLVTPSEERVVDSEAAREFAERVPGVSFTRISGARHEILMEQDHIRRQFWAAFDSFAR